MKYMYEHWSMTFLPNIYVQGTEAVEGIIFGTGSFVTTSNHRAIFDHFAIETFKRMSKLKFLYLEYVKLTGSFEQTFKDLRWLHWEFCPLKCLPSDFYPQRLVILALPHSKLTTMWELNRVGTVSTFLAHMITCIKNSDLISSNYSHFCRFHVYLKT